MDKTFGRSGRRLFVALALLGGIALRPVMGAVWVFDGQERDFWKEHSVVYGRVLKSETSAKERSGVLKMRVLATLAGPLDPSTTDLLMVEVSYDPLTTGNVEIDEGALVIAVITQVGKRNLVPYASLFCFMPKSAGIFAVKSMEDPAAVKTIELIRKARATPPDPNRHPGQG